MGAVYTSCCYLFDVVNVFFQRLHLASYDPCQSVSLRRLQGYRYGGNVFPSETSLRQGVLIVFWWPSAAFVWCCVGAHMCLVAWWW